MRNLLLEVLRGRRKVSGPLGMQLYLAALQIVDLPQFATTPWQQNAPFKVCLHSLILLVQSEEVVLAGLMEPVPLDPVYVQLTPAALPFWTIDPQTDTAISTHAQGERLVGLRVFLPEEWRAARNLGGRIQPVPPSSPPTSSAESAKQSPVSRRGLSYRELDQPLILKMRALIAAGRARGAEDAARAVVADAVGAGKVESKVKRLVALFKISE